MVPDGRDNTEGGREEGREGGERGVHGGAKGERCLEKGGSGGGAFK